MQSRITLKRIQYGIGGSASAALIPDIALYLSVRIKPESTKKLRPVGRHSLALSPLACYTYQ